MDETWSAEERNLALEHLKQGRALHYWMGMETCLLGCNQHLPITGCTDGTYYWPESLLHYVAHHAVRLPDAWMLYVHRQPAFPTDAAAAIDEITQANFCWWQAQQGWHPQASSLQYLSQQEIRDFLRRYDRQQIEYSNLPSPADIAALERMVAEVRQLVTP
ncbi:hypothetical protein [Hymenobacter sp. UYP22]|uniref:hypothetical protein n=1 Tax=Hymenobacter sp. UYP22 TaxID=3156348 RepID=UPI003398F20C